MNLGGKVRNAMRHTGERDVGPVSARKARPGQIIVLFAFVITALLGMAALAVDLGHAMERRQFLQGVATNTALAGAFEAHTQTKSPAFLDDSLANQALADSAVVQRMVDTLGQNGLGVANLTISGSGPYLLRDEPSWSACAAGLSGTQVFLEAYYIDNNNNPVGDDHAPPVPVGRGAIPDDTQNGQSVVAGVQITHLSMCVPAFFSAVLGRHGFDIGASDLAGAVRVPSGG